MNKIHDIFTESELTMYSGETLFKYLPDLNELSQRNDFIKKLHVELDNSITENKLNSFLFIPHILVACGNDSHEYQMLYFRMIDFANNNYLNRTAVENQRILEILLDLFWHQDNGLKKLSIEQSRKLYRFLAIALQFKYMVTENGDEIFFGVKKTIDLIKLVNSLDERQHLINLYVTHFDEKIRQEAIEMNVKNSL